jgi:hypothetical protein
VHVVDTLAFDADYSMLKNQPLSQPVSGGLLDYAGDADGDPLTVSKVNGTAFTGSVNVTTTLGGMATVFADGSFNYMPPVNAAAGLTDSFTFTVTDGMSSSTATANLNLVQVLADDCEYSTVHNQVLSVPNMSSWQTLINHSHEADNAGLSVTAVNGDTSAIGNAVATGNGGTVTVQANGSFVYTPPANFVGDDWFSYTVSNANGDSSTATCVIHVTNTPPTANPPSYYASQNTTLNVPSGVNMLTLVQYGHDDDGDALSVVAINGDAANLGSATATSQGGSVTAHADGTFSYTPPANWTGDDTFTFTLSDGFDTVTVTCTIHVS